MILNVIQRKVLRGTHLSVEIEEIQARYFNSSHFKDIYLYLAQNNYQLLRQQLER